jgi:hypothetical protein
MMQKRASSLGKFLVGIAASLEGSQAGYTKVTDKYVSVAASILRTAWRGYIKPENGRNTKSMT